MKYLISAAVAIVAASPVMSHGQTVKKPTVASVNADLQATKADLQAQINALKQPAPAPSPTPTPTPAANGNWQRCAGEGGTCALPRSPIAVRYGVDGAWVTKTVKGASISCSNEAFGDPAVGRGKTCEVETIAATTPTPAASDGELRIGMNLDGDAKTYWGTNFAFLDRMRVAGGWNAVNSDYQSAGAGPVHVDPKTGDMGAWDTNIVQAWTLAPIETPDMPIKRRYRLSWDGKGSVTTGWRTFTNTVETPNSLTFDYVDQGGVGPSAQVVVQSSDRSNPVRNIRFVRADQAALLDAGQVFTPEFLAKTRQWPVLRFMDWGCTNGSQVAEFDQLQSYDKRPWECVPLKAMVDLANLTGSDMWYCLPIRASDDMVRRVLAFTRANLKGRLHLELSNEVWNWGFEQTHYAKEQGDKLGPDLGNVGWYGYRSAQIAKIADEIYGADSKARVANVIATQTVWQGLEDYTFKGIRLANLGTPSDLFEEYAVTTYFGWTIGGGSDADRALALSWARGGEAGMAAAFKELTVGGQLADNSSIAVLSGLLRYQAGVAKANGLDLVAYEGGWHLTATGYPNDSQDQKDFVDFMARLAADPRIGTVYAASIDAFRKAGGKLLVAFNDNGGVTKWGGWGVSSSVYETASPRYDAYVAAQRSAGK